MEACLAGHEEIVRLLLDFGADREFKDRWGRTALVFAAASGEAEIARWLLEAGPAKTAQDRQGKIPKMWASTNGKVKIVCLPAKI